MKEIRFQKASPILLKFLRLLAFAGLTCLLLMYLAIKFNESLIFLDSNTRYLIEPCNEIEWKLPSHRLDFIGAFRSYRSWILMTIFVMEHWTLTIFYFIFFYFSWFYFSFSLFYFPGKMMKQAHDKEVTWQVTWCDVIGLECGRRI